MRYVKKNHLFVIQSQETLFNKSDDFSVQLQITISLLIIVVDIAYMYTNDREVKSKNFIIISENEKFNSMLKFGMIQLSQILRCYTL